MPAYGSSCALCQDRSMRLDCPVRLTNYKIGIQFEYLFPYVVLFSLRVDGKIKKPAYICMITCDLDETIESVE